MGRLRKHAVVGGRPAPFRPRHRRGVRTLAWRGGWRTDPQERPPARVHGGCGEYRIMNRGGLTAFLPIRGRFTSPRARISSDVHTTRPAGARTPAGAYATGLTTWHNRRKSGPAR